MQYIVGGPSERVREPADEPDRVILVGEFEGYPEPRALGSDEMAILVEREGSIRKAARALDVNKSVLLNRLR